MKKILFTLLLIGCLVSSVHAFNPLAVCGGMPTGYGPELITDPNPTDTTFWSVSETLVTPIAAGAMVADNAATYCRAGHTFSSLPAGTYRYQVEHKAGDESWARVGVYNTPEGSQNVYCDLSNGAMGTQTGGVSSGSIDLGSGWYRIWINFTITTANTTVYIYAASDNETTTISGDGSTVQIYMQNASLRKVL